MVFRKGGVLPRNLVFYYNGVVLEIVKEFKYLGIVFKIRRVFFGSANYSGGTSSESNF